jgi:hypothetical protein
MRMSAHGTKRTLFAAAQHVCFQAYSGPLFLHPNMSANVKRTSINLTRDGLDHANWTLGRYDAVQPQAG